MRKAGITDLNRDSGGKDDLLLELLTVLCYPVHRVTTTGVRPAKCGYTFLLYILDESQPGTRRTVQYRLNVTKSN